MSTHAAAQAADSKIARKPILKTYSRRTLTRRISSPPVPVVHYDPRLTQSFTATTTQPRTPTRKNTQQSDFSVPGPKRVRFSANDEDKKSPTDLFFDMISSSAPAFLLSQQGDQQEEVVLLSTEVDDDDLIKKGDSSDELLESPYDKIEVEQDESQKPAVKAESEEPVLQDESDVDEPEEEFPLNEQPEDPTASSPVSSAWQSSPPISRSVPSMPKAKGRFLTFKKADDRDDFKSVGKRPQTPASERLRLKVLKRTSDGFDSDEKHASPYRKQRRINNDMRMGSLELTQKGTFTQKLQGPTWLKGQKKPRTASIASLWSRRQYLGNSKVKAGSEDLLDSFEEQTVPHSKLDTESGRQKKRQISIEESNDADEEVDLLVFPPDDVDDDDGEIEEADDDELALLVEPDELGGEHHAVAHDEDVGLLVIPRTDPPDSDEIATLDGRSAFWKNENRLPPKQQWHQQDTSVNRLALRPDDGWLQDVRKIPETPFNRKRDAA